MTAQPKMSRQSGSAKPPTMPIQTLKNQTRGPVPTGAKAKTPRPRYKIQVDGEEREVSLNEALRGYQREETFNTRMRQMVEVAKTIDERGAQAQASARGLHRALPEPRAGVPGADPA